jgi:hypothetical protein
MTMNASIIENGKMNEIYSWACFSKYLNLDIALSIGSALFLSYIYLDKSVAVIIPKSMLSLVIGNLLILYFAIIEEAS